jgi:hypothetical protein
VRVGRVFGCLFCWRPAAIRSTTLDDDDPDGTVVSWRTCRRHQNLVVTRVGPRVAARWQAGRQAERGDDLVRAGSHVPVGKGWRFAIERTIDAGPEEEALTNYSDGGSVWVPMPAVRAALAAAGYTVVDAADVGSVEPEGPHTYCDNCEGIDPATCINAAPEE